MGFLNPEDELLKSWVGDGIFLLLSRSSPWRKRARGRACGQIGT